MKEPQVVKVGWQTNKLTLVSGLVTGKEVNVTREVHGNAHYIASSESRHDVYQVKNDDGNVHVVDVYDANLGILAGNQAAFVVVDSFSKWGPFSKGPFRATGAACNLTTQKTSILDESLASLTGFDAGIKKLALAFMGGGIAVIWIALSSNTLGRGGAQAIVCGIVMFAIGLRMRLGKRRRRLKQVRQAVVELIETSK